MDRRTLLVLILSTFYIERKFTSAINNIEYYDEVLEKTKPAPAEAVSMEMGRDPAEELLKLVDRVKDFKIDLDDTETFLQKVRLACSHDSYLFDSVEIFVRPNYEMDEVKRKINQTRGTIAEYMADVALRDVMKIAYRLANVDNFSRDEKIAKIDEVMNNLLDIQTAYGASAVGRKHPALINSVTISSEAQDSINIMAMAKESIAVDSVFVPGWQCVKRQFGKAGGGRPGESLLIGAMEYNYKSSMCLQFFRWSACYNTPKLRDPTKKPLLYRMSLENDLNQDILFLYQEIYANEYGKLPDMDNIDVEVADKFVKERLQRNGWHVIIEQYDPNKLTYHTVLKILDDLQAQGYEIHLFNVDYIAMIDKAGCTGGAMGDDIRLLFRRVANYCKSKHIWFITPHQIGSKAFELRRQGREDDFVKDIAGKGYWDGCQRLGQEPDMDLLTHVVKMANGSYLTSASSRHRGFSNTPVEDLFWIRKFEESGFIPDDIYGADMTRSKIGGGTMGGTQKEEEWAAF